MTVVYVELEAKNMMQTVIRMAVVYVLVIPLVILDVAVLNLADLDVIIHAVLP